MAANALIQINGYVNSLSGTNASTIGPINLTSATAAGSVTEVVLQSGANTITTPTAIATSGCIIQLPATNTAVVTLKGVSGDTGIAIGKTTTLVLNWDSTAAPASFVLNSASTQTGLTTRITYF